MKYLLLKDKRRRVLFNAFAIRRKVMKAFIQKLNVKKKDRTKVYLEFLNFPRDSSITRIRNRCVLTNRPRAVYKKFGLSRLMFRKYV